MISQTQKNKNKNEKIAILLRNFMSETEAFVPEGASSEARELAEAMHFRFQEVRHLYPDFESVWQSAANGVSGNPQAREVTADWAYEPPTPVRVADLTGQYGNLRARFGLAN